MELTRDLERAAQTHLTGEHGPAPREVVAAMVALSSPYDVQASLAWTAQAAAGTWWCALWLAGRDLTFCDAFNSLDGAWGASSAMGADASGTTLTAWSVDVTRVTGVSVVGVRAGGGGAGGGGAASTHVRVKQQLVVEGFGPVSLPLGGGFPSWREEQDCGAFVGRLRGAMRLAGTNPL